VAGSIVLVVSWIPVVAGQTLSLELNANSSDVEGKIDGLVYQYHADLFAGAGVLYSKDEYLFTNLNFSLRDKLFTPALTLGLGLKGVIGRVEFPVQDEDAYALGFMMLGAYDFREDRTRWPVSVTGSFTAAPYPLSFGDTESYLDANLAVNVHVVRHAAIVVGYRYIDVRFKRDSMSQKKNDHAALFGLKLSI
jgi:hypothetical protein